jgi:hypothetical protein
MLSINCEIVSVLSVVIVWKSPSCTNLTAASPLCNEFFNHLQKAFAYRVKPHYLLPYHTEVIC